MTPLEPEEGWGVWFQDIVASLPRNAIEDDPDFEPTDMYPNELVIAATGDGVEIRCWTDGIALPARSLPRWEPKAVIGWNEATNLSELRKQVLSAAARVRRTRMSAHKRCGFCSKIKPPEHMMKMENKNVCMACAESELGVVF